MSWTRYFRRRRWDEERARELEAHLEIETDDNIARGMSPEEARYAAHRKLGNTTLIREEIYHMNSLEWLETLWQDLRYGLRQLKRSPGFTAVAVLTLALGIGANTAFFSVVNAVLLRPLSYKDPGRLMMVMKTDPKTNGSLSVSIPEFSFWREHNQGFDDLAAFTLAAHLGDVSQPGPVRAIIASANFFALLGVRPVLGRDFLGSEERPGANHVVVLSHGLWEKQFGSDPNVIGRTLRLDEKSYSVVGVMPPSFQQPLYGEIDLWVPLTAGALETTGARAPALLVLGRLKPSVTLRQAEAQLEAMAHAWLEGGAERSANLRVEMESLQEAREVRVGDVRLKLVTMFGAVGFVLLIACANLANLLLARATVRQKEIAIRTALGATRLRVIRQVLTESMLLALGGGAGAILLAFWGVDALKATIPVRLPLQGELTVDTQVLVFALAVSVLTGLAVGIVPALRAVASKPTSMLGESLKEGGRAAVVGFRASRAHGFMVVSEVALSLVLAVGAGLMIRTFLNLRPVNLGFEPASGLAVSFDLPQSRYPTAGQQAAFVRDLLQRVESVPAVKSAAATTFLPMSGFVWYGAVTTPERLSSSGKRPNAFINSISENYLQVMRIDLLNGRPFTKSDSESAAPVALVNRTAARTLWPGEDPVGKQLIIPENDPQKAWRVVGVTGDVRQYGFDTRPRLQVYLPYPQCPTLPASLVVRCDRNPAKLIPVVRGLVAHADKELDIGKTQTLEELVSASVESPRFYASLVGTFALLGLTLAAVGVYGVASYSVGQRTHEIGVRMALGAVPWDVLRMVMGQGMVWTLAGVAAGLATSFALTRFLASFLYGVRPTDPGTFVLVSLLLIGVATLACYLPARRATKVDPMVALRYE